MDSEEIQRFVKRHGGWDFKSNFSGVFAADEVVDFKKTIEKLRNTKHNAVLPCCIVNTDRRDKPGTHWIACVDVKSRDSLFVFDSFGRRGFNHFFVKGQDDVVTAYMKIGEFENKRDYGGSLQFGELKVDVKKYKQMEEEGHLQALSDTAAGLSKLFVSYAAMNSVITLKVGYMVDQVQDINTEYCGVFCLYFLYHLYNPDEHIPVHGVSEKGDIKTIQKVIKGIFVDGADEDDEEEETTNASFNKNINTILMRQFVKKFDIKGEFE